MFDAYKIGVAIDLNSNGLGILSALSGGLMKIDSAARAATGKMDALKVAALGAMGVVAGGGIAKGLVNLVEHGQKLKHQQSLLLQAGYSQQDMAFATGEAYKAMNNVLGTGTTENLELLGDLRNRLGDLRHAVAALPEMAKLGVVLSAGTGQSAAKAGDDMARFLELRGALVNPVTHQIDPEQLKHQARLGEAIAVGTHFKVGPSELLGFQQQARASGAGLSEEGLVQMVPYVQAGGGHRTGTQLASLHQQTLGGVMTAAGADFFVRAGMLNESKVHIGRGGKLKIDDHAWKNEEQLRANPAEWINKTLRAGLVHMGARTVDEQAAALMRSHLRGTVVGLLVEGIRSAPAFAKDAELIKGALAVDHYEIAMATDPTARMKAFKEAWDNLLTSLGAPLVDGAYRMLGNLTTALTGMASWAGQHPAMVEQIGTVAAAFAGLLGVGGVLAIGGAAVSALGVLSGPIGLAAVAAGIVGLAAATGHFPSAGVDENASPRERAGAGLPQQVAWSERIAAMLPTAQQVATALKDFVPRALGALWHAVDDVGQAIGHAARRLFDTVSPQILASLGSAAGSVLTGLGHVSAAILEWIAGLPAAAAAALGNTAASAAHALGEAVTHGARVITGGAPLTPGTDPLADARRGRSAPHEGAPLFQPQSFVPPPARAAAAPQRVSLILDHRQFAEIMLDTGGRLLTRPQYGMTGHDPSMSPIGPGAAFA